jgi:hypothetical protein
MRIGCTVTTIVVYIFAVLQPGLAQSSSLQINLSIDFESKTVDGPSRFVFIKGALAGVAPGIVTLPSNDSVPVEIGIEQLKFGPLYSFEFGPNELKEQQIDLISTSVSAGAATHDEKSKLFVLNPNTKLSITLTKKTNNSYSVILPDVSYREIDKYINLKKSDADNYGDFVELPLKTADNYSTKFPHLSYDKAEQKTVFLEGSAKWSGAYVGFFDPFHPETEKWTIVSNPNGATIFTSSGQKGITTSIVDMPKSVSSFVVLQMTGYRQCVEQDCEKSETMSRSVTLKCDLKKLP